MPSTQAAARQCEHCQSAGISRYYLLGGHVLCAVCAPQFSKVGTPASFGRPLLYGTLTAAGIALILAWVPNLASVLTIFVAFAVAQALRAGAGGLGGRKLQVLAVLLTYSAVTLCVVPSLIRTVNEQRVEFRAASPADAVKLIGGVSAIALVAPFLDPFSTPAAGLFSLLFILMGLWQAWRMTGGISADLSGPFEAEAPA